MTKRELLARMQSTRQELETLLAQLSPDQLMHSKVTGEWTVKDMLAHIAWYQAEEVEFFGETGVAASPLWATPQEARNELLFAQNRERPLDEILAAFRTAFTRFLVVVEGLTDDELNQPGRFPETSTEKLPWQAIAVHSYEHDREHIAMIRDWMQKR
ncbi:MAG: DinB family protein [Caldilineaceae bacterium]